MLFWHSSYGTATLQSRLRDAQNELRRASPFDRERAQARVNAVQAEIRAEQDVIARKTFVRIYPYEAPIGRVRVQGNESSLEMQIYSGLDNPQLGRVRVSFPVPNVVATGNERFSGMIKIFARGHTDRIQDLVHGSGKYQAIIRFTNLRSDGNAIADILSIDIVPR